MRIDEQCFQCLLSRVEFECRLITQDQKRIKEIVHSCSNILEMNSKRPVPAPVIASSVHQCAYSMLNHADPYYRIKKLDNQLAVKVCKTIQPNIITFRDRVLASIIGNTIDYGVENHNIANNFLKFFKREFKKGLQIDHTEQILGNSSRIVYFTDNCGEIIFDQFVIKYLKQKGAHITLAVKGAPILNDATIEDVVSIGMDKQVDILTTTGSGDIGISIEKIPSELRDAIERCTLIIAKGMANYESLNERDDLSLTAYLMAVKCDPIAASVGVPKGSYIALLSEK